MQSQICGITNIGQVGKSIIFTKEKTTLKMSSFLLKILTERARDSLDSYHNNSTCKIE